MNNSEVFLEAAKINEQFRKEIRRRDIDRRFAQRRKQLLQEIQNSNTNGTNNHNSNGELNSIMEETSQDRATIIQEFQNVYNEYMNNNKIFNQNLLSRLAAISCTITGAKIILEFQLGLLTYLRTEYILNQAKDNTSFQTYSLIIFNNCLAIADIGHTVKNGLKYANFNAMTSQQIFVLRLFTLSLQSQIFRTKQNALCCIFSIMFNNDANFAYMLVSNPKYNIMSLLLNHMHRQPKKEHLIEVFKIFYITLKKLNFRSIQQFGKMRKFIINTLRNSNCREVTIISIVCLHALLKCFPNERITVAKSGILKVVFEQTLILNENNIVIHTLRIGSLMVEDKNENDIKLLVSFIEGVVNQFTYEEALTFAYKIMYEILIHTQYTCQNLLTNNTRFMNKTMQLFQSNFTPKQTLVEIGNLLPVIVIKAKDSIDKSLVIKIKDRMQDILDKGLFDQAASRFLEHNLSMLGTNNQFEYI